MPSQSLSCAELQSRRAGNTAPWQGVKAPFWQVLVPRWQMPLSVCGPQAIICPSTQGQPPFGVPSQVESSPAALHESAALGPMAPVHGPQSLLELPAPRTQACSPPWHGPLPSSPGCSSHACLLLPAHRQTSSARLSGRPSQSLSSAEAQSRDAGRTAPTHDPHAPLAQVRVPSLQIPSCCKGPQDAVLPSTQSAAAPLAFVSGAG
jgi:hypothetical protein